MKESLFRMFQSRFSVLLILIFFTLYVVLFISLPPQVYQFRVSYQTLWQFIRKSTDDFNDVDQNFVFLSDKNHWNFSLKSMIHIHLEADITPNINNFINNSNNNWRSMPSMGIKIRSSDTEILHFIVSEFWYTADSCHSKMRSLYMEVLTSNYRKISSNWSTIVSIPSIIPILQSNLSEYCSELFYPRMINTRDHQMLFAYLNKERQMELYNPLTRHRISLHFPNDSFSSMKRTLTPFVKNNQLHFVYSYKPLKILRCSGISMQCEMMSEIQLNGNADILQDGTQLIQFRDTEYFVGIASISVSCSPCTNFSRPHLIVLSTIANEFRLIYVSEPFELDHLPNLAPSSMLRNENSTDYCYGVIRTMIPGFILDWEWPSDKFSFTLSINHKSTFLISIEGIGKIVQSLKYTMENSYSNIFYGDIPMIFHSENRAFEYCEYLSTINQLKYQKMLVEIQNVKANVIKDIVDSPTYPSYRIVSNAHRDSMKGWIAYDFVNYGLIGRYLTDYNLQQGNPLMIDAGGNHGMYSLYGAMLNQTVYVFEVLPKYWIVFEESLQLNIKIQERIVLRKCGISDQYNVWHVLPDDGTTRLIYPEMNRTNRIESANLTLIEVYPLDEFIFQRISVMKIDVEGFEIRALKGATRAIQFFGVGAILIEIAPFRWSWNNLTTEEGIAVLEYVTATGHYSSYIIARDDAFCPQWKIANITGIVAIKNLTMMNMIDGHLEIAPHIYQFNGWTTIINYMKSSDWSCNFWLES